ncbi:MAG: LVIVD repeat-containing protein [Candidatus Odinarchaeota archaeon]
MIKTRTLIIGVLLGVVFLNTGTMSTFASQTANQGLRMIELGQVASLDDATDVHVVDSIAYVSDMGDHATNNRIVIIDVFNPLEPQVLSEISIPAAHTLQVVDNIAYVANGRYGLTIIDVSDPSHPCVLSSFSDGGEIYAVCVYGDFAFAGDAEEEIVEIIDIQDPFNPVEVGQFQTGIPYGMDVEGDIAVIGTLSGGLLIYDVSNYSQPALLWESEKEEECYPDVKIIEDIVYVSCYGTGFKIFNISNPTQPEELCDFQQYEEHLSLDVVTNLVCQAVYSQGVSVINVTDISNPVECANYYDGGKAKGIDIVNDLIFVADHSDGLEILKLTYGEETSTVVSPAFELLLVITALVSVLVIKRKRRWRKKQ